jgi:hypothetical protein
VPWQELKSGSVYGRGGYDLTLSCSSLGRGRARVRAEGGRGDRGGLWVNTNGDMEEHTHTMQGPFAMLAGDVTLQAGHKIV